MTLQPANVRVLGALAVVFVSATGLIALFLPFLSSALADQSSVDNSRSFDSSLLLGAVVAGSMFIAIGELARGPGAESLSRSVALLGTLVAIDATLRLVPSFFGASPIFALIALVGYVFGSRFGFVMGSLTLLLSAAITAGVGPWLPFQMLCAGWMGMAAGWLPKPASPRVEVASLALFGGLYGFVYGALMNLYSWPFASPGASSDIGLYWSPTLTLLESLDRYWAFYITTSLVHDASRTIANIVLILAAGASVLRLLRRFHTRTTWKTSAPGL